MERELETVFATLPAFQVLVFGIIRDKKAARKKSRRWFACGFFLERTRVLCDVEHGAFEPVICGRRT